MSKNNVPELVSFEEAVVQIPWQLGKEDRGKETLIELSGQRGTQGERLEVPLGSHALLWAIAWPYRYTTRQPAGNFPPFLGLGIYFIQGAFSSFGFRQAWFLVHSLYMCPCPKAVQDVIKPIGVWLLVWTTLCHVLLLGMSSHNISHSGTVIINTELKVTEGKLN